MSTSSLENLIHVTKDFDYFAGKYVYSTAFPSFFTICFLVMLYVYTLEFKTNVLILAALFGLAATVSLYFIGQQLINMRKINIGNKGVQFADQFVDWKDIVKVRQFFIFRIEFFYKKNNQMQKVTMPLPFSMENFTYPLPSRLLTEILKLKDQNR